MSMKRSYEEHETDGRRMPNLERSAAVSNATSNSLISAVCLQVTDPVLHLCDDLVLLQPEMPLNHLPITNNQCHLANSQLRYTIFA